MIKLRSYTLKDDKKLLKEFNSGKYARKDYRRLYKLTITHGELLVYLATPSLRQALSSIPQLWNAREGQAYERNNHPVVMETYNVKPAPKKVKVKSKPQPKKKLKVNV